MNIRRMPSLASVATYLRERYKQCFQRDNSAEEEEERLVLHTKQFESMSNLRLLQLSNVILEGYFKHLPATLRWLQWRECPLEDVPLPFPRELAVLDLSESKIKRLWDTRWWFQYNKNKVEKNLMIINLYGCYNITSIPDLSAHPALKKLNLERCKSLTRIHKSIGDLTALRHLNLKECSSLSDFPCDVSGLKSLESLNLSGCSKLKNLPEDMSRMVSLKELVMDRTAISKLPDSIIRLTKLERLNLCDCKSLTRLPAGIGNLISLRKLLLDDSALEVVPNSIGSLKNLKKLSLIRCTSISAIPETVGNLESLSEFLLNGSSVTEMPASIGSIHYLKYLSVANCCGMSRLPVSIERLASMTYLQLDGTSIRELPHQIAGLKSLRKFEMRNCESLISLPPTFGRLLTLEDLVIQNAAITELPKSIGMLENLIMLNLNRCRLLHRLPDSIGGLKSLHHLLMEKTAVSELPETFGMLSNLMILKMGKMPWHEVTQGPETKLVTLPSSFSNLSKLEELDAKAWRISGKIPNDFERLSSLEILNLSHNNFSSLPSSLGGLTILKKLLLEHCKELKVIPPLPSNLVEVNAANCIALESISDLSNLEILKELNLTNCEKLVDISGLERLTSLRSLRRLHMIGCDSCSSDVKEKLNKVFLKNLHSLSMPGNGVPDWFTPDVISFSKRKHYMIEGLIIVVVVSVNHQIEDNLRDQLPVLPDIEAKILRLGMPVFCTALHLLGVPKTDEDQVYLCRYFKYHPLVSIIEDGDVIQVAMKSPPAVQGVELKKTGIHIIFDNDDDYDGDEGQLDEHNKTVSERLTRFIKSPHDGHHTQETERRNQDRICCFSAFKSLFGF